MHGQASQTIGGVVVVPAREGRQLPCPGTSAYETTSSSVSGAIEGDPDKDAVLVTVESLAALRRAYPNYFLATTAFLESVEEAIE